MKDKSKNQDANQSRQDQDSPSFREHYHFNFSSDRFNQFDCNMTRQLNCLVARNLAFTTTNSTGVRNQVLSSRQR